MKTFNLSLFLLLSFIFFHSYASPPPNAVKACVGSEERQSCSFSTQQGSQLDGTCQMLEGVLACNPEQSPTLSPQQLACQNLTAGAKCSFEGLEELEKGVCKAASQGLICLVPGAPALPPPPEGLLPPPEDKGNLSPPPPLPTGESLPPPPTRDPPPPQAAITACQNLANGARCQFTSSQGDDIHGTCQQLKNQLACNPPETLRPPPYMLPGTYTNQDNLQHFAKLFRTRWDAHRANVEAYHQRHQQIPQNIKLLTGGEAIMTRVENESPVFFGSDLPSTSDSEDITPAAQDMQADIWWNVGVTGDTYTELGIWDAGKVLSNHSEFDGRVSQQDAASNTSDHATHVAGIMVATGKDAAAQGIAFRAALQAYDWEDDSSEMAMAAANGLKISNHSYGVLSGWVATGSDSDKKWCWYGNTHLSTREDYKFGYYSTDAESFDQVAADAAYYLIVKAAGNDRDNNPKTGELVDVDYDFTCDNFTTAYDSTLYPGGDGVNDEGYDTLMPGSTAKNILTVGAVDAQDNISAFSAWGPTDDGRIKPDLVAYGVGVYSTSSAGAYTIKDGTSMAAPTVAGSLALWRQYWRHLNGEPMRAATWKALALHTAKDLGQPGPDYQYGWGRLNNPEALALLQTVNGSQINPHILELSLAQGSTEEIFLTVPADTPALQVTLTWQDPPGQVPSIALDTSDPILVDDLDLRVVSLFDNTVFLPWTLNPDQPAQPAENDDNDRDNIEQIIIANPTTGNRVYKIQVSHKGELSESYRPFSLIITGNAVLNDAEIEIRQNGILVNHEDNFSLGSTPPGNAVEKTFTVINRGGATLTIANFQLNGAAFSQNNITDALSLAVGESAEINLSFRSDEVGEQSGSFTLTTNDEDESTYTVNLFATVESASSVNQFSDSIENDGQCSLREAILNLNANQQLHTDCPLTETLELPSGTFTLNLTNAGEDADRGDLDITRSVSVIGQGMDSTIIQAGDSSSNGIDRVFEIAGEGIQLNLEKLTIRYGNTDDYGGGILFSSKGGKLTLSDVKVNNNTAARGGGLYLAEGEVEIYWSSISGNTADTESGNGGGGINCTADCVLTLLNSAVVNNESKQFGGGIIAETATIKNTTISGNNALAGGGLLDTTRQTGTLNLENVTVYGNTSLIAGYQGGVMVYESALNIHNSIIAGNTSSGIASNLGNWNQGKGVVTSLGYNLSDTEDWTPETGDLLNKDLDHDIQLRSLNQENSHLPEATSLALNAGQMCVGEYDQRGQARLYGEACDIGALEVQADEYSDSSSSHPVETPVTLDWQRVMNWAEVLLPEIFPVANRQTLIIASFKVRHYPQTNSYLGYNPDDEHFYVYNPEVWGEEVVQVGNLADYLPQAEAEGF